MNFNMECQVKAAPKFPSILLPIEIEQQKEVSLFKIINNNEYHLYSSFYKI